MTSHMYSYCDDEEERDYGIQYKWAGMNCVYFIPASNKCSKRHCLVNTICFLLFALLPTFTVSITYAMDNACASLSTPNQYIRLSTHCLQTTCPLLTHCLHTCTLLQCRRYSLGISTHDDDADDDEDDDDEDSHAATFHARDEPQRAPRNFHPANG
jgi:hypothetical protein